MDFVNDYHVVFDFGMHKGKRIMDVPRDYLIWVVKNIKNKPEVDAINRIFNRRGVTTIIKRKKVVPEIIPEIIETSMKFEPIRREVYLNPSMFGSFVEYLIKNHLKLSINDQAESLLAKYGLVQVPTHLVMEGENLEVNEFIEQIHESYLKSKRSILDILYLSFCHSLEMESFRQKDAKLLINYVTKNQNYFEEYLTKINLPSVESVDQSTCDKISVGCVCGVIDMISEDSIIDIKCTREDNVDYYRMQLYAYACLHHLRYNSNFSRCEIYNFLTGKHYVLAIGDSMKYAKEYIKSLSNLSVHQKLFE